MDHGLSSQQIARYSRQLLIQDFGVSGQVGVCSSKTLVVGAGGLGCPVATYLAGAGIGTIGIVDYDEVAIDNLHRQVAHREKMIGKSKVESLKDSIKELNSLVNVVTHNVLLDKDCALDVLRPYDIVVDCSDNPATSGSALRWEGQLTVYHFKEKNGETGPCYRCLFPVPTNPSLVTNCSEGGVLGPVVGVIGSLQALEVLKIAAGLQPSFSSKLYLFDGSCGRSRTIALRPRNKQCAVCGDSPTITELIDYVSFCGSGACDKIQSLSVLSPTDRVSATDYAEIRSNSDNPILLDTRPPHEFAIASLKEAKNVTLDDVQQLEPETICKRVGLASLDDHPGDMYVICHRGNDSQLAVEILKRKLNFLRIRDIRGGYEAWATEVDQNFPRY
ncbi:unnamed protein product [Nippostrongylus brasiliensis]|uniref:Adenylyltransferase and sulfurtransferase MOCS3 (inferred by orthology to a C. elegans protein) n=1 Tax=Nippostrongylus brasiliensis TaxID=27835 RepID=A0A158R125_NIPBR|nr:unnamed protein product [Nippostrongylus brasiliensis]